MTSVQTDQEAAPWMQRALELARRGSATTHPNPRVGCVIVVDGEIVGEGFHRIAGEPHAEVLALRAAGDRARGADVFVTLEPCSHQGRTPPCADALIKAGVGKVWVAMQDPNPKVAGSGLDHLQQAGIAVACGIMADEAEALNRGFMSRMTRHRPWVTLKSAASLDGRTAMATGESQWITGPAARTEVHRLRAEAGAVLTASATVLADNPRLTVRDWDGDAAVTPRQPDRIVLDGRGRLTPNMRVFSQGARRLLITAPECFEQVSSRFDGSGVEVHSVKKADGGSLDLTAVMTFLATQEVNEVLVECGAQLSGALLQAELVDEWLLYVAPCLLGDAARPLALLPGLETLSKAPRFEYADIKTVGEDLRLCLRPINQQLA